MDAGRTCTDMCHTVQMDVFLFSARHVPDTLTAQAARKEGAAADVRPPTHVFLARTFFFPLFALLPAD